MVFLKSNGYHKRNGCKGLGQKSKGKAVDCQGSKGKTRIEREKEKDRAYSR